MFMHFIKKNIVVSMKFCIGLTFCAGPSLPGLATVSVLLFERKEYFHSTSHLLASKTRTSAGARLLPGSSSCATEHLLLSSFQTHTSQPFIGKRIRKPRVTTLPRNPRHTWKCRAGGKPSTWFPPGTRTDHLISNRFTNFPSQRCLQILISGFERFF